MATDFDGALPVRQATAADLNATVVQATAANLNATVTGSVVVTSATASDLNATVVQATAADLNATVVQATAADLNATVVQATAADLNATVVQATAANLNATVSPASGSTFNVNVTSTNPVGGQTRYIETSSTAPGSEDIGEMVPTAWPFYIDSIFSSASGKIKVELWTNAASKATPLAVRTGGVLKMAGFTAAGTLWLDKHFDGNMKIVASDSVYVILKNMDNQAQSMYTTLAGNS